MLDLAAGTGSFRVREMMHRIAYPLGVHVRADVNLTDIEASCTDGKDRITEVVDLPTTGVNTERVWLLEHFADWFNVNLGTGSMYHRQADVSEGLMEHLDQKDASQVSADLSKQLRAQKKSKQRGQQDDPVLICFEEAAPKPRKAKPVARPLHLHDIEERRSIAPIMRLLFCQLPLQPALLQPTGNRRARRRPAPLVNGVRRLAIVSKNVRTSRRRSMRSISRTRQGRRQSVRHHRASGHGERLSI